MFLIYSSNIHQSGTISLGFFLFMFRTLRIPISKYTCSKVVLRQQYLKGLSPQGNQGWGFHSWLADETYLGCCCFFVGFEKVAFLMSCCYIHSCFKLTDNSRASCGFIPWNCVVVELSGLHSFSGRDFYGWRNESCVDEWTL